MLRLSQTFMERLTSRDIKPALFFDLTIGDDTFYMTDAQEDVSIDGNTYISTPHILGTSYPAQDTQTRRKLWTIQLAELSASPDDAERFRYRLENRTGNYSWTIGNSASHDFEGLPYEWLQTDGELVPDLLTIAPDGTTTIAFEASSTALSQIIVPDLRARINLGTDQFVATMMTLTAGELVRSATTAGQQFHALIAANTAPNASIEFYYAPPLWAERFREVGLGRCKITVKVALANEDDTELSDTLILYSGTLGNMSTQDRGPEGIVTECQFTGPFVKLDNQHGRYLTTQSQMQFDPNDTAFDFIHRGEGDDEWEV